jgi:WD40 repeat protein
MRMKAANQVAVAISNDSRLIANTLDKGIIHISYVSSGLLKLKITGHHYVYAVMFSQDGDLLYSASQGSVITWDLTTGSVKKVTKITPKNSNVMAYVSPDRQTIACGCTDGMVLIYNVETGTQLRAFKAHNSQVEVLVWSSDSRLVASAGQENNIVIHEAETGKCMIGNISQNTKVYRLVFNTACTLLATSSSGPTPIAWAVLHLWQLNLAQRDTTLIWEAASMGFCSAVSFSPHDRFLVVGGKYDSQMLNGLSGNVVRRLEGNHYTCSVVT